MAIMVKVTYFDTAMALIEVGPLRLLTDPVLDPADTRFDHGPVHLHKTSPAVPRPVLGRVDVVLLSHDQHGDNLDTAGRAFLETVPLVLTTPLAAGRLEGVAAEGLDPWSRRIVRDASGTELEVTAVPAQHGPDGTQDMTGPVTGFVLEHVDMGGPIYVSGDTVPFSGTEEIARRHAPVALALLHIGRVRLAPTGDIPFSMSADDAARLAEALDARWVVPLHFDGWEHFTEGGAAAAASFDRPSLSSRVRWLAPGQTASFEL